MFTKNSCINEIASSLEENIIILTNEPNQKLIERKAKVIEFLTIASELLDQSGFEKESAIVTDVLQKFAEEFGDPAVDDPALPHSSDEAVKNLEEKGWMFNVGPDDKSDKEVSVPKKEDLEELFKNF